MPGEIHVHSNSSYEYRTFKQTALAEIKFLYNQIV